MSGMFLTPRNDKLELNGKVSYNESEQAWNVIRLRKPLLREFSDLKDKKNDIYYYIIFFRTFEELLKNVDEMNKKNHALPLLLFFYKM